MNILKTLGAIALSIVVLALFLVLMSLLLAGSVWWTRHIVEPVITWLASHVLRPVEIFSMLAFAADLVVLLPLSAFRSCRPFSTMGLLLSSALFGINAWLGSLVIVFYIWGTGGVLIGLLLGGVGVIPLALIASAIHSEWASFLSVLIWLVLLFVVRAFALFLASGKEAQEVKTP